MSVRNEIDRLNAAVARINTHLRSLGLISENQTLDVLAPIIESLGLGKGDFSALQMSAPQKTVYEQGEKLDLTGTTVTALYDGKDITSKASFQPSNGAVLSELGEREIIATYKEGQITKTANTFITVKKPVPSWSDGTWIDIKDALAAHDRGEINIYEHWNIGDSRTISLAAMEAKYVDEAQSAQNIEFVIVDEGMFSNVDGNDCHFVIQAKDMLGNTGMYGSRKYEQLAYGYVGPNWSTSERRNWCNEVFYNALPSELQNMVQQVSVKTNRHSGAGIENTEDRVFLASVNEVFGTSSAENRQMKYYEISDNRIKKLNGTAYPWWLRSAAYNSDYASYVRNDGGSSTTTESTKYGISPCFCI